MTLSISYAVLSSTSADPYILHISSCYDHFDNSVTYFLSTSTKCRQHRNQQVKVGNKNKILRILKNNYNNRWKLKSVYYCSKYSLKFIARNLKKGLVSRTGSVKAELVNAITLTKFSLLEEKHQTY